MSRCIYNNICVYQVGFKYSLRWCEYENADRPGLIISVRVKLAAAFEGVGGKRGGGEMGGRCLRRCGREEEPVFLSTSSHKSIGFQATNDEDGETCQRLINDNYQTMMKRREEKTEERGFGANSEKAHIKGPKLKPNR